MLHRYIVVGPIDIGQLFDSIVVVLDILSAEAAYTIGGHSSSADAIEYEFLKMKPPLHRPQIALLLALHKLKVSDEQRKSVINTYEPLVNFSLICGMYYLLVVTIYTAQNVRIPVGGFSCCCCC